MTHDLCIFISSIRRCGQLCLQDDLPEVTRFLILNPRTLASQSVHWTIASHCPVGGDGRMWGPGLLFGVREISHNDGFLEMASTFLIRENPLENRAPSSSYVIIS